VQEIVLTGVNLGDFGKGLSGHSKKEENFFDLIQALEKDGSIPRYRISSIEPNLLSDEIIEFVASSKHFMPHFHIPLQSGHNEILGMMRRRYRKELYEQKVALIKKTMPHCCIGVDVIVGFPGETDELFQSTYDFLHQLDISYLHVFTYSERDNTLAIEMENAVPIAIRKKRNKMLRILSAKKLRNFYQKQIGKRFNVIFEHENKNGFMYGFTQNYIKVKYPFDSDLCNKPTAITITEFDEDGNMNCELVEKIENVGYQFLKK
jgi:threonylcarbamoyladenosine tRNA methylthiotransferase MtaB